MRKKEILRINPAKIQFLETEPKVMENYSILQLAEYTKYVIFLLNTPDSSFSHKLS